MDEGYSAIRGNPIDFFVRERNPKSRMQYVLLKYFEKWLKERGLSMYDFQVIDVKEYIKYKIEKGDWRPSSANTFLNYLKSFCKWLKGYAISNVERARLDRIKDIREINETYEVRMVSGSMLPDDYKKLLDLAHARRPAEDFSFFWCLGYFGMRVGELVKIKKDDIFEDGINIGGHKIPSNAIWIRTEKTSLVRILFFDDFTYNQLINIINYKKLTDQTVRNRIYSYQRQLGIDIYPHMIRRIFNSSMGGVINQHKDYLMKKYNVAIDDRLIKILMGHKTSIARDMTTLYSIYPPELIKELMVDLHYMKEWERDYAENTQ